MTSFFSFERITLLKRVQELRGSGITRDAKHLLSQTVAPSANLIILASSRDRSPTTRAMVSDKRTDASTVAVHGGERPDEQPFGPVVSPAFHSANLAFETFDQMRCYPRGELGEAYFYSRYADPSVSRVERKIADSEGAEACVVTRQVPRQRLRVRSFLWRRR